MGGVIVHHQVDVDVAWNIGLDLAQEGEELTPAMAGEAVADGLSRRHVERCDQ